MSEIRKMDISEFRKEGFLQEVNRLFFHPLGLALEIVLDDCGNASLGGIWDYRDDPGGIFYDDEVIDELKIDAVEKLRLSKIKTRTSLIFFDIKVNADGIQIKS